MARGAASTGFRAPSLAQSNFSAVSTNFINIPGQGTVPVEVGTFAVASPVARALGATDLKPENSVQLTAGFAFTPRRSLDFTADYFNIAIDDRIVFSGNFTGGAISALLAPFGASGARFFTNAINTRTQGVDITAGYRVPASRSGTLDLTAGFNWTQNRILDVDPLPQVLIAANSTEPGLLDSVTAIGIEDERPDWRGTLQANLTLGRFSSLGRFSYFGGFSSAQPGFCDLCRDNYGGKGLVDAEIGYQFNLIKLAAGVRNLFDTYPDQPSSQTKVDPTDPESATAKDFNDNFGIFPWAAASPFGYNGRYVYARTEVQLAW